MMRVWRFLAMGVCAGFLLVGCGLADRQPPLSPTHTAEQGDEENPSSDTPPTATPEPFKTELVLCAPYAPSAYYDTADPVAQSLLQLVTIPPVTYNPDYTAQPGLIVEGTLDDLQVQDDGTILQTFRYRDDLVWSDGQPFDPVTDPMLGLSLPSSRFAPTFPILEVNPGDTVIQVKSGRQVEYPYIPSQPPLPAHLYPEGIDPAQFAAEGYIRLLRPSIGPYYMTEQLPDGGLVFAANPHFFNVAQLIPTVRFQVMPDPLTAVSTGVCDVVLEGSISAEQIQIIKELDQSAQVNLYNQAGSVYERLVFNTYPRPFTDQIAYFADVRVRQAIRYGIEQSMVSLSTFGGFANDIYNWLPANHWASAGGSPTLPDAATAVSLLDQAGWHDTDGDGVREYQGEGGSYACQRGQWTIEVGTPLVPTLLYPEGDFVRSVIADQIKADLDSIGFNVLLQPFNPSALFDPSGPITHRTFDMVLMAGQTRPDPGGLSQFVGADVYRHPLEKTVVHRWELEDRWLDTEQLVETLAYDAIPGSYNDFQGQNFAGWCHDAANILIVEANLTPDLEERQDFYTQHQAIFAEELPFLPLFARPRLAVAASYVCGIEFNVFSPLTWNVDQWYFDETGACIP